MKLRPPAPALIAFTLATVVTAIGVLAWAIFVGGATDDKLGDRQSQFIVMSVYHLLAIGPACLGFPFALAFFASNERVGRPAVAASAVTGVGVAALSPLRLAEPLARFTSLGHSSSAVITSLLLGFISGCIVSLLARKSRSSGPAV